MPGAISAFISRYWPKPRISGGNNIDLDWVLRECEWNKWKMCPIPVPARNVAVSYGQGYVVIFPKFLSECACHGCCIASVDRKERLPHCCVWSVSRDVAGTKWRAGGEVQLFVTLDIVSLQEIVWTYGWKHQCCNVCPVHGTVITDTSVLADCRPACINVCAWRRWQTGIWGQHETSALRDGDCKGRVGCDLLCVWTFRKNLLPSSEMSVHIYETVRRHSDIYMPWSELPPFRRTDLTAGSVDSCARECASTVTGEVP